MTAVAKRLSGYRVEEFNRCGRAWFSDLHAEYEPPQWLVDAIDAAESEAAR